MSGFSNAGKSWGKQEFATYAKSLTDQVRWASFVVVHHTWNPDLAMRPLGLQPAHIDNLRSFYQDTLRWSGGPHFFVDGGMIHGMTPPDGSGVHARSFNPLSIGVEMLGNYDKDDPKKGRGFEVVSMGAFAVASILLAMGKPANADTIKFHREEPGAIQDGKSCPGLKIEKDWFVGLVVDAMADLMPKPKAKACGFFCEVFESLKRIFTRHAKP